MASILLASAATSALSSYGPVALTAGSIAATMAGGIIDNHLFGLNNIKTKTIGHKLSDLYVQSSAYASIIPVVYGTVKLAGNIIWALPLKETVEHRSHSTRVGKGGGKKVTQQETMYVYYATFAIALCKGEIDEITKIWADEIQLNPSSISYRFYKGSESQQPDPIIEAHEGVGKTPAYRGISYIVIENFPLTEYGNRIPNFSFEVVKKPKIKTTNQKSLEEKIEAITIIPGSGECVYDTIPQFKIFGQEKNGKFIQRGKQTPINTNNREYVTDAVLSLKQLSSNLSNLKWISIAVCWFADSLDIGNISIKPGIEFNDAETTPTKWIVGKYNRKNAKVISKDKDGFIRFGGTPSDESLHRFIDKCKEMGYKIMLYPMIMVDLEGKPWRGHITGSYEKVDSFFNKEHGYNDFIMHYAKNFGHKVDAFSIGSELKGITAIEQNHHYVAVHELIKLAKQVRKVCNTGSDVNNNKINTQIISGSEQESKEQVAEFTKNVHEQRSPAASTTNSERESRRVYITYAADWSEYHHDNLGNYNLDELWASEYIDFVGIDAYFPITSESNQDIKKGWESGEYYDEYDPPYALKNIRYWWNNYHYNNGKKTKWVPKMKPIWFTEFGFPSVDKAANQPNVFYDPESIDGGFPRGSNGNIDFEAQYNAINESLDKFKEFEFLDNSFLWCWDARPYPYWPELKSLWRDHELWKTGHWINGKIGRASLSKVITELMLKAGFNQNQFDTSLITGEIDGFIINEDARIIDILQTLGNAYFFNIIDSDIIRFVPFKKNSLHTLEENDLIVSNNGHVIEIEKSSKTSLDTQVDVVYISRNFDYQQMISSKRRETENHNYHSILHLPLVISDNHASKIAEYHLYSNYLNQITYKFKLASYFDITIGDIVKIGSQTLKVSSITYNPDFTYIIDGHSEYLTGEVNLEEDNINIKKSSQILSLNHEYHIFELPNFFAKNDNKIKIFFAACSLMDNFVGLGIFNSTDFTEYGFITTESKMGYISENLPKTSPYFEDHQSKIHVSLISGDIFQTDDYQYCLIEDEVIAFKNVEVIDKQQYILSNIIRVYAQDHSYLKDHEAGERFILLDESIQSIEVDPTYVQEITVVISALGEDITEGERLDYKISAQNLKPISPIILGTKIIKSMNIPYPIRDFLSHEDEKARYLIEEENGTSMVIEGNEIPKNITSGTIAELSQLVGPGYKYKF